MVLFWKRSLLAITLLFFVFPIILFELIPFDTEINYSTEILSEDNEVIHVFLSIDDQWRLKTKLEDVSANYLKLILYKEDKYFYYHFGVNPFSVIRALYQNIKHGRVVSGASTITMQLARMLEPKPRTFKNKLIEMFRAFQLEYMYDKNDILEMYVNLLPFGGNVVGVRSASLKYFGKEPNKLSLLEAAALVHLSDNPKLINDVSELERRAKSILLRFSEKGLFSSEVIKNSLITNLKVDSYSFPRKAPHFSIYLKKKYRNKNRIYTYLDLELQGQIESLVYDYVNNLYRYGISNLSVLVVRNRDGAIISYLGSADFYNNVYSGQVDGVMSYRSPGSTLKPLLYAYCMEKGILTPKRILYDVPINIGGYSPENYDGEYRGKILAGYSLAKSLNVPAVRLLKEIGLSNFLNFLIYNFNFREIRERSDELGLSLILGACEVSLYELVSSYMTFANSGVYLKLKFTKGDAEQYGDTLFSSEVCYWITNILSSNDRPDISPEFVSLSRDLSYVAWKTGTSYGYKDAWCIGYTPEYTIGVWSGNFDGTPSPYLNGRDIAVPIMFRIVQLLKHERKDFDFITNKLGKRKVCSESGLIPSEFCESYMIDEYIKGKTKLPKCNIHKKYLVSPDYRYSYCQLCLPKNYTEKVYLSYPMDYESFLRENGYFIEVVPEHYPGCRSYNVTSKGLKITFPVDNYIYYGSNKLLLRVMYDELVKKLWVVHNGKLLGEFGRGEVIEIIPQLGMNEVECIDNLGRSDKITFFNKKL